MEKRPKGQSHLKVIELTADKEVPSHVGGRIIELTQVLDSSGAERPLQESVGQDSILPGPVAREATEQAKLIKQAEIDAAYADHHPSGNVPDPEEVPLSRTHTPEGTPFTGIAAPSQIEEIIDLEVTLSGALENVAPEADGQEIIDLDDRTTPGASVMAPCRAPDDIIDLTDVVTPGYHAEEIIDLTDVVAPGSRAEEIIDLTDVVTPGSRAEEIIDLTDSASAAETAHKNSQLDGSIAPDLPAQELDLVAPGRLLPVGEDRAVSDWEREQIIPLAVHRKTNLSAPDLGLSLDDALSAGPADDTAPPLQMIGIALEKDEPAARGLSPEALEAAVEKVLYTKYADRIERLIAIAVEKAVTREIEQIKREFMDELDPRDEEDPE